MTKSGENQPLLLKQSMTMQQPKFGGNRAKWRSYKYPEVKHELILYAELAAAAAFIVGLYLLALLPWEYIHRAQMLQARLHPGEITSDHVKSLIEVCQATQRLNEKRNITNSIAFQLAKRPCTNDSSQLSSRYDPFDLNNNQCESSHTFSLRQPMKLSNLMYRRYYQDMFNFFYISCCYIEKEVIGICPCGYQKVINNKCYALIKSLDCGKYGTVVSNITVADFKEFLQFKEIEYYCYDSKKFDLNDVSIKTCAKNTLSFIQKESKEELHLCEAEFVNETQWWRPLSKYATNGKLFEKQYGI